MPADLDAVDIYLLTYDVGDEIYTKWGHVTVRVRDRRAGTDLVFDWGYFDFSSVPRLAVRFLKGHQTYVLRVQSFEGTMQQYRPERRTIWQDEMMLTEAEKARLLRRLIDNARLEDRGYPYDGFDSNCATKIRDHLDQALDGRVAARFQSVRTTSTRRDHVRSALRSRPFVTLALDVLMNEEVDRSVSAWEDFFLPLKVREHLLTLPASPEFAGATTSLLAHSRTIVAFPARDVGRLSAYPLAVAGLGPLLILGFVFALLHPRPAWADATPVRGRWRLRLIGVGLLAFGLPSAALGTLMALAWIVSEHTLLHHNANLWVFWPTDWLAAAVGLSLTITGRPWPAAGVAARLLAPLAGAHLVGAAAYVTLWAAGLVDQRVDRVLLYLLPLTVVAWATVRRLALRPERALARDGGRCVSAARGSLLPWRHRGGRS